MTRIFCLLAPAAAGLALAQEPESPPLTPAESMAQHHVREGFVIELVAAEPMVLDPVAIDWSPDGKLWIAEMADYPNGMDDEGEPGGRIRFLEDTDGDGKYDRSQIFAEGLRFPNGVMAWKDGVLITAAPDIIFARDTDGDGRADEQTVLYTGFTQGNQQLRVNGLRWGLDNWIHVASGAHHGGYEKGNEVVSTKTGEKIALGSRDFRIRPDTGEIDPQSGPSQFGRNRDDWGNWFGVQNSMPLWHYVLADHDLRRNPHFIAPDPKVQVITPRGPKVYPAKAPQQRYHGFDQSGRFTSACSAIIYRDELLFPRGTEQHSFTCEPFHNLVQHNIIVDDGVSFTFRRDPAEAKIDFFASKDRWCRPVMARTGPDGALWVVDMYRYMIEHPKWLPDDGKQALRPFYRHGEDRGRIYRIYPKGKEPRKLEISLESPNGWARDQAQQLLIENGDPEPALAMLKSANPLARLHALCTLDALGALPPEAGLTDEHPGVRREAARLATTVSDSLLALADDPSPKVRLQLAATLGGINEPAASLALAKLAREEDAYVVAAAMSSVNAENIEGILNASIDSPNLGQLLSQAAAWGRSDVAESALGKFLDGSPPDESSFRLIATLKTPSAAMKARIEPLRARAAEVASDRAAPTPTRVAAIALIRPSTDLLAASEPIEIQQAAVARIDSAEQLLENWAHHGPALRGEILNRLLTRDPWIEALLNAIEAGEIRRGDLDAATQQRLRSSKNAKLREQASKLLVTSPDREKVINQFRPALKLDGNVGAGKIQFEQRCAACHKLGGIGRDIGPSLAALTNKQPETLLTAILDPNAAVEAKFGLYMATTKDNQTFAGMVASETGTQISLLAADGTKVDLLRRDVSEFRSAGVSLMPIGLEAELSNQNLADLIEFVRTAK
ncbi:MAG: putative membrane-bound dehydrogenase-like protein [Verrucomicrobiales bacterium]|jgi:putative membrane-bound dehydrogenase-like protein